MTYFAPCFNCVADKATCERRATMRKAIKGTGITSAKFNCPDRQAKFRRGQRVEFDWRHYEVGDYDTDEVRLVFRGTIMHEKPRNTRFAVRVDQDFIAFAEGEEPYALKAADVLRNPEFISVRHTDIRAIDEPDRLMCKLCAAYDDDDGVDLAAKCWGHGDLSNVHGLGCSRA